MIGSIDHPHHRRRDRRLLRYHRKGVGFGLIGNIIVGIVGAFIGTWVLGALGVMIGGGIIASIINATIGAVILLFIIRLVKRA